MPVGKACTSCLEIERDGSVDQVDHLHSTYRRPGFHSCHHKIPRASLDLTLQNTLGSLTKSFPLLGLPFSSFSLSLLFSSSVFRFLGGPSCGIIPSGSTELKQCGNDKDPVYARPVFQSVSSSSLYLKALGIHTRNAQGLLLTHTQGLLLVRLRLPAVPSL